MKSKADKILVLLVIGLVFPSIINTNFNLSNEQKTVLNNPDITESYIENYIEADPIFINGTATGVGAHNWTWAVSQSWCSGNGIYSDPYIIENLKIKGSGFEIGIEIWNSNVSFIIQDCLITNTDLAIWIENVNHSRLIDNDCSNNNLGIGIQYSNNNTISGNTANDNNQQGIYLYDSDHNYITENTANDNDNGVEMDTSCDNNYIGGNTANNNTWIGIASFATCHFNNISGNTANNNSNGIYLDYCDNNTISGNLVNNSTLYGVFFDSCVYNTVSGNVLEDNEAGIFLYVAINNFIIGNIVRDNTMSGIYFDEDSDYQEITENIIYNNTIGIDVKGLNDNNLIYNNFFLKNGKHAFDDGTGNKWNSTTIGNYWDNHTGPDTNNDGIVDNPYTFIDGPAGSIDYLPIAEDGAPRITIISPSEGQRFGSDAPTFNVTVIDIYVAEMWYILNEGLNNYTFTGNGTINQTAWDALPEEEVTIQFYARDIVGNVGFEEVTVIKDVSAEGLDPGVIAVIVVLSVIGGLALLGAILGILVKKGKISLEKIKGLSFRRK